MRTYTENILLVKNLKEKMKAKFISKGVDVSTTEFKDYDTLLDKLNTGNIIITPGNPSGFNHMHCTLELNERGFYTLHIEDYKGQATDNYMVGSVAPFDLLTLYITDL